MKKEGREGGSEGRAEEGREKIASWLLGAERPCTCYNKA